MNNIGLIALISGCSNLSFSNRCGSLLRDEHSPSPRWKRVGSWGLQRMWESHAAILSCHNPKAIGWSDSTGIGTACDKLPIYFQTELRTQRLDATARWVRLLRWLHLHTCWWLQTCCPQRVALARTNHCISAQICGPACLLLGKQL